LLLFAVFVGAVCAGFGAFPSYGQPDPKQAGLASLLHIPALLGLILGLAAPLAFGPLTLIQRGRAEPLSDLLTPAVVGAIGWLVIVALFTLDPLGLGTWLMD